MSHKTEQIAVTVAAWVVMLQALAGVAACSIKPEKTPEPVVAAADVVAAPVAPQATLPDMVAAMLRGHPNARQVCVDGNRERAFFLDYGPHLPLGSTNDGQWHGWIFIEKVDFYATSNNTWFIIDQTDNKYLQVYPDVTGLMCKPRL